MYSWAYRIYASVFFTSLSISQWQASIIPIRYLDGGILHVVLQNGEAACQVRRAERVHHVKPLLRQEWKDTCQYIWRNALHRSPICLRSHMLFIRTCSHVDRTRREINWLDCVARSVWLHFYALPVFWSSLLFISHLAPHSGCMFLLHGKHKRLSSSMFPYTIYSLYSESFLSFWRNPACSVPAL